MTSPVTSRRIDGLGWVSPSFSSSHELALSKGSGAGVRIIAPSVNTSTRTSEINLPARAVVSVSHDLQVAPIKAVPSLLSQMSAKQRLRFLAKNQPFEFVSTVISLPGAIYLMARALFHLFPGLAAFFTWEAMAQTNGSAGFIANSGRDAFDWYVGGLMGACLLAAVCATLFAQNEDKISFGKDTTKTIIGFVIGFLSGGKAK